MSGSPYRANATSPCSVTLKRSSTVPGGWARIARAVGPPPLPSAPPRPWKIVRARSRVACPRSDRALRGIEPKRRREHARFLRRVGVAEHHLEPPSVGAKPRAHRRAIAPPRPGSRSIDRAPVRTRTSRRRRGGAAAQGRLGERARTPLRRRPPPRVKLTITRWQRHLDRARPGSARSSGRSRRPRASVSVSARRSTSACCRTSIDARWKPNASTWEARLASSPSASTAAPPARRESRRTCDVAAESFGRRVATFAPGAWLPGVRRRARASGGEGRRAASGRAPPLARGSPWRPARANVAARATAARRRRSLRAIVRSAARRPRTRAGRARARSPPPRA